MPRKPFTRFAVQRMDTLVTVSNRPHSIVALPDPGTKMANGSALLTGSDLDAWRNWRLILRRSPSEFHEAIALEGRVAPHTDPELKRKLRCYARLLRDVSVRGLVSFGPSCWG